MRIGSLDLTYLSHVCFRFRTPEGKALITDPFFAEGFEWQGGFEQYLSPPDVPVTAIRECDAVFVSHIHGDHCDPAAIAAIHRQTGAAVLGPADVLDLLRSRGLPESALLAAEEGAAFAFGDLCLRTLCGYDRSFDGAGRPNKFSLVVECAGTRLFYSGDTHELPPGVRGAAVDGMLCWPHPDDGKLKALFTGLWTPRVVLMHGDRFDPGNFHCNLDMDAGRDRVRRLVPGLEVLLPERARSL